MVVIVIIVVATSAGGGDNNGSVVSDKGSSKSQSNAGSNKDSGAKQGSKDNPFKVGQTIELEGTHYTVTAVKTQPNVGGQYGQKADGVFVVVNLTIENTKDETKTFMDNAATFIAKDGTKYEGSDASIYLGDDALILREMQPDLPTKGKLVFDVPPAKAAGGLLKLEDLFGRGESYIALGLK